MRKTALAVLALALCGAVFTGCPREDSCYIDTLGIFCNFRAVEENGVVTATAVFSVGGPFGTELALGTQCGDTVTVNGVAMMEKQNVFVYYEATINPAATYTFEFTRPGEATYTSTVTPPPAVAITAPADGTELSRAAAFDVTWTANAPDSPRISLYIGAPCIDAIWRDVADNGLYTINAGEIALAEDAEDTTCDGDIVLSRDTTGTVDPGLEGVITARTVDRIWFTTAP